VGVPFAHKGHQSISHLCKAGKVGNAEPFPLEVTLPLLHVIHPRTMDWRKTTDKARMVLQPRLHLLALVHFQIVHHQIHTSLEGRKFLLQLGKKGDELALPFASLSSCVDLARACIKGGKQM
jgi:hypothetical protein